MIYNKNIGGQLLGVLFKRPDLLSDTDKYILNPIDFPERLPKLVFSMLYNFYISGMTKIEYSTFLKELSRYPEQLSFFQKNGGEDFIINAIELGEEANFDFYYNKIKKLSLLRSLQEGGFDISSWYVEGLYDINKREMLELKLDNASVGDILAEIQGRFFDIESVFINKKTFKIESAAENIKTTFSKLKKETALGLPLSGDKFSTVVLGARKTKFLILSGETGAGKTRIGVANAAKLAFPILWDIEKGCWANTGSNQKIIFVTTELSPDEIHTIMVSYISGVNEHKMLNNTLTENEQKRIDEAINIIEYYGENFWIYHLPDPNVQQLTVNLRRYIIKYQLDCVFFDYIHTSPSLLNEFAGAKVREDVALMLLSTALKNIANEHKVFVWSATQLNGTLEEGKIADVGVIRGSKAIIDKVDTAGVLRRVSEKDLKNVGMLIQQIGITPTHTIDVFKNRRGRYNKVRLWIQFDLGTMRANELFLTDEFGGLAELDIIKTFDSQAKVDNINIIINPVEPPKKGLLNISL